jgi:hypothetical protein
MNLRAIDILNNGGCSYSLMFGPINSGYAVSVEGREEKIPVKSFGDLDIKNYVLENSDLLSLENYFLGAWVDGSTVYLDVSERFLNKDQALAEATARHQKAIYDLKEGETIWLK